jgi:hypothetical protein
MVNADIGSKMQLWQLKPTNHVIVCAWARVRHSSYLPEGCPDSYSTHDFLWL